MPQSIGSQDKSYFSFATATNLGYLHRIDLTIPNISTTSQLISFLSNN